MMKFIIEVCDANDAQLAEPVFVESARDFPMAVMQAVQDFIDAHEGEITTPLAATVRRESEDVGPCSMVMPETKTHA